MNGTIARLNKFEGALADAALRYALWAARRLLVRHEADEARAASVVINKVMEFDGSLCGMHSLAHRVGKSDQARFTYGTFSCAALAPANNANILANMLGELQRCMQRGAVDHIDAVEVKREQHKVT